jgi:streptogramin lyase
MRRCIPMRMTNRKMSLLSLGTLLCRAAAGQQGPLQQSPLQTDGKFTEFSLPNPRSGPTTIAIAPDGTLWFTEGTGNRIGRMAPDGTGIKEYDLPNAGSSAAHHRARRG